jgi:uncharacterized protein
MRTKARLFSIGVLLVVLLLHAASLWAIDIPKLKARVTDLAGVLTPDQATSLEEKLRQFEVSDSTQIAVLIIPSLEGEVLEDLSERVATAWRLGQKGRDNGALLFVAMKERRIRIEAGYGLEPTLTDIRSSRIIQNEILPAFRQQQYYEGIDAGVTAIIQTVRGVYQGSPQPGSPQRRIVTGNRMNLLVFLLAPMLWLLSSTGKWGGGILGGGAGVYLIYALLGLGLAPMLIGGLIGSVLGVGIGALVKAGSRSSPGGRWGGFGGPFFPGGFGGGGMGGGGFGGGSFSGGGGGFGGGGASGKW